MLKKVFHFPSKNLALVISITLVIGFLIGYFYDTSFLKPTILWLTFFMIYPTMIGFNIKEAYNLSYLKVVLFSLGLNFILIPLMAYGMGLVLLKDQPAMFAGLALTSLLPTSGMTISWTMIFKGNVPAAIKMTAIGLIAGSLLAPWYLLFMVGKLVPIDVGQIFTTIAIVVFMPLILGNITFKMLLKRMTPKEFQTNVKPYLPSASIWAMLVIIFVSISMKAKMIVTQPQLLLKSLIVLLIFYVLNLALSTVAGKLFFDRGDGIALVYGTVMRNLSITLGVALQTFGVEAALIVTLAFIVQVQTATWYGSLVDKLGIFGDKKLASQ